MLPAVHLPREIMRRKKLLGSALVPFILPNKVPCFQSSVPNKQKKHEWVTVCIKNGTVKTTYLVWQDKEHQCTPQSLLPSRNLSWQMHREQHLCAQCCCTKFLLYHIINKWLLKKESQHLRWKMMVPCSNLNQWTLRFLLKHIFVQGEYILLRINAQGCNGATVEYSKQSIH